MPLYIALISLLSLLFGNDEAEIVFAGDAMMHQAQIEAAHQKDGSYDFSEYFKAVEGYVGCADYAVVNLETPVSNPPYSGYPCFNAPEEYIDALADAGFDLFLTANNHTLDRRDKGLRATIQNLDKRRLDHIGTYTCDSSRRVSLPFIKNINNIRISFLNYTYGTNGITPGNKVKVDYINRELIRRDVEAAKEAGAEFIIVCIHWGNEYKLLPDSSQRSLAQYINGLGVDAIIGSHPHVIQPMEMVAKADGKQLTVYSLGNFISNMRTTDTRGGAMVKIKISRGDDGKVRLTDSSYRLVFTEPQAPGHNFRLSWAELSKDSRAAAFAKSARNIFKKHNKNVEEELPGRLTRILAGQQ